MSRKDLADAFNLLAEACVKVAIELESIESAAVRDTAPTTGTGGVPPQPPVPAASFDELPPEEYDDPPRLKPQVEAGLGKCPVHGVAWTVKAGGVSKAGKEYSAFWRCAEKDGDSFCKKKPQPIWAQTHPAERAA